MATLEEEKKIRQTLKENLAELVAIDPESLARTTELGTEVNFEAGVPVFRRILELFKDLAECDLDGVPFKVLDNMDEHQRPKKPGPVTARRLSCGARTALMRMATRDRSGRL